MDKMSKKKITARQKQDLLDLRRNELRNNIYKFTLIYRFKNDDDDDDIFDISTLEIKYETEATWN